MTTNVMKNEYSRNIPRYLYMFFIRKEKTAKVCTVNLLKNKENY